MSTATRCSPEPAESMPIAPRHDVIACGLAAFRCRVAVSWVNVYAEVSRLKCGHIRGDITPLGRRTMSVVKSRRSSNGIIIGGDEHKRCLEKSAIKVKQGAH